MFPGSTCHSVMPPELLDIRVHSITYLRTLLGAVHPTHNLPSLGSVLIFLTGAEMKENRKVLNIDISSTR